MRKSTLKRDQHFGKRVQVEYTLPHTSLVRSAADAASLKTLERIQFLVRVLRLLVLRLLGVQPPRQPLAAMP